MTTGRNDVFVASFVGSPAMNLIPGELRGDRVLAMSGKVQLLAPVKGHNNHGAVMIGIRSEDVRVGPQEATEAKVHDVENHGVGKDRDAPGGGSAPQSNGSSRNRPHHRWQCEVRFRSQKTEML